MYYILIVVVLHGHIHQKTIIDKVTDQAFRNKSACEEVLNPIKTGKRKRGSKLYMACVEATPALDYHFAETNQTSKALSAGR